MKENGEAAAAVTADAAAEAGVMAAGAKAEVPPTGTDKVGWDEGEGEDEDEDAPVVEGVVEILTDENFERLTQVSTGATTGDWFVSELWVIY